MEELKKETKRLFNVKTLIKLCFLSIRNSHCLENLIHLFLKKFYWNFSIRFVLIVFLRFLIDLMKIQRWDLIWFLRNQWRSTCDRNEWIIAVEGKLSKWTVLHSWTWRWGSLLELLRRRRFHWSSRQMLRALSYLPKVEWDISRWTVMIPTTSTLFFLKENLIVLKKQIDHHIFNFLLIDCLSFNILYFNSV